MMVYEGIPIKIGDLGVPPFQETLKLHCSTTRYLEPEDKVSPHLSPEQCKGIESEAIGKVLHG